MTIPVNTFKRSLHEGKIQIGLWQGLASPVSAEICAGLGFDWLLFDGEHGPNDVPTMLAQLQAVSHHSVHPVARLPVGDTRLVKQYLDLGFPTLLIPMVDTAEHAADMVRSVRYPPRGKRGVAPYIIRASQWNSIPGYLDEADAQVCLLVQAETRTAIENLDAIAATDGVDGVFIGPSDLSASMGHRGDSSHPDVQATIADAIARIRRAGKPAGILAVEETAARRYLDLGCQFVAVGSDISLLSMGGRALARKFKG
ncbi:MAG: 2-keto-3-deoxy-L-rhamnonate aldolase [Alphaproteobacteria bacterium]|nr:2-keto-3-deoxy-L-rhamnonate aldolase [Alphaproteobacteria bacterium]